MNGLFPMSQMDERPTVLLKIFIAELPTQARLVYGQPHFLDELLTQE